MRALADFFPEIEAVVGCPFNCDPTNPKELCDARRSKLATGEMLPVARRPVSVVELPIGATEDRLVGTIDIEKARLQGCRRPLQNNGFCIWLGLNRRSH